MDGWDVEPFDRELRGGLDAHTDVIRDDMLTSRRAASHPRPPSS